jgi:hypothetical protein
MNFSDLKKLEKRSLGPVNVPSDTMMRGIVKVKKDRYRPAKVKVRSELGERIFTADFLAGDLASIEADPDVEAISVSKAIPLQKLPDAQP